MISYFTGMSNGDGVDEWESDICCFEITSAHDDIHAWHKLNTNRCQTLAIEPRCSYGNDRWAPSICKALFVMQYIPVHKVEEEHWHQHGRNLLCWHAHDSGNRTRVPVVLALQQLVRLTIHICDVHIFEGRAFSDDQLGCEQQTCEHNRGQSLKGSQTRVETRFSGRSSASSQCWHFLVLRCRLQKHLHHGLERSALLSTLGRAAPLPSSVQTQSD